METVLVTGGLGRSGRWIVDRLAGDYRVVCVDPDYVVHWAAIPVADRHAGSRVFETNALAAYNTLSAVTS